MQYDKIKQRARHFRKNPTYSEKLLWRYLKRKQLAGRKFQLQYPIIYQVIGYELFFFIADFYCHSEKLIIELDGPIHEKQKEKDQHRDEILSDMGYRVLRIENSDLMDIKSILRTIESQFYSC